MPSEPEVFGAFLARLDADGSGGLSSLEYEAAGSAAEFAATDADGDGLVSAAELTAWIRVTTPRPEGLMLTSLTAAGGAAGAIPVQIGGPPVPGVRLGVDPAQAGMDRSLPRSAVVEVAPPDAQDWLAPGWTVPTVAIGLASLAGIAVGAFLARRGRG